MKIFRKKICETTKEALILLLVALVLTPILATASVSALSQAQIDVFNLGIGYFNVDTSCPTSGSASLSPGSGLPTGTAFPNLDPTSMANAINTWIKQQNPNSELNGLGSTIVASGKNSNVNPFLIVVIAKKESSLADPHDFNVSSGSNSFGRTAGPGQPSFKGSRTWYYWSSVKASVDYTAPENQNAKGGGDMATYLRDEYGQQIDSNSLLSLMTAYAPPSENNTTQYINQITQWTNQLVALANGGSTDSSFDSSTASSSDSQCDSGAGISNFVFYNQCDSKWGNDPYGDSGDTICSSGCGPTSVAMVVATMADSTITPDQVAAYSMANGGYENGTGTSWGFLASGPEHWGLGAQDLGTDMNKAIDTLNQGGLVIAAGTGAAPFTTEGHILVLKGVGSNGNILVADPFVAHTQTEYSVNDIQGAGLRDLVAITK